jgi:hypothetical protein
MKIQLTGWRKRPDVVAFIRWLETVLDIRHPVEVVNAGDILYGYFEGPRLSADRPRVVVVADSGVLDTIAHEFVHYEQWRDKREMTERGVAKRAAALVKRWKREAA